MGDLIIERIQSNLLNCLQDMDDVLEYCQDLLDNNNVIILIERSLYHEFKNCCDELTKVRTELYTLYLKLEEELSLTVLDLTLEGYEWIEEINNLLTIIEEKWTDGEIDVNKYLLAQNILNLNLVDDVVLDIDDLEHVVESSDMWVCVYTEKEANKCICHCVAWKTKNEALVFAMQTPNCRRDLIFNRFTPQIKM